MRHEHEWKVWKEVHVPEDRILIPGVISHVTNVVEHPELVADRLIRFAEMVGRERVMAGSDCGFAQAPLTRRVHPSIQWAKLRAQAEGARITTAILVNSLVRLRFLSFHTLPGISSTAPQLRLLGGRLNHQPAYTV